MNTAQLSRDLESCDELSKAEEGWRTITNRYNLRPQPTQQNKKYIMTQDGQQSANKNGKTSRTCQENAIGYKTRHKRVWWERKWGPIKIIKPIAWMTSTIAIKKRRHVTQTKEKCATISHVPKVKAWQYHQRKRKYIWRNENVKPMLYIMLKKAIYGTLQAAILFWRLLSDALVEWGLKLNENYICAVN